MIAIRTSTTRALTSRRAFLRGIGASAALVPLLESDHARAAGIQRFISIGWSNGVMQSNFYPSGDDPTGSMILAPLAPYKTKVTVVAGLDCKPMLDDGREYDAHFSYPSVFTGTYRNAGGQQAAATGPSLDQRISEHIAKTINLRLPLLNVAAAGRSVSFGNNGQPNTAETNPARLYMTLFSGNSMPVDRLAGLRARRKSVLDYVNKELGGFGARLGKDDKDKLAAHTDSIRKLEMQLDAEAMGAGGACTATSPGTASAFEAKVKAFSDLLVAAIKCDLTRAASLTWAADGGSDPGDMTFLNLPQVPIGAADGGANVHAIAHNGPGDAKSKIDTWYMGQLAYLAKGLAEVNEGGASVLDSSLILMANSMAEGSGHSVARLPFVMVGTAGGALPAGRVVKVGGWAGKGGTYWTNGKTGVPHNRLMTTVMNAFGIAGNFGNGNYGGTLSLA